MATKPQQAAAKWFVGAASATELKAKLKELAKAHHPDRGGAEETMKEINVEYAWFSWLNTWPVSTQQQKSAWGTGGTYSGPGSNPFGDDFFSRMREEIRRTEEKIRQQQEAAKAAEKAKATEREPDGSWMHDFFNEYHGNKKSDWQEPKRYYERQTTERRWSNIHGGFVAVTTKETREDKAWRYYQNEHKWTAPRDIKVINNLVAFCKASAVRDNRFLIDAMYLYLKDQGREMTRPVFFSCCLALQASQYEANELAIQYNLD
jgi:hypothetical protein